MTGAIKKLSKLTTIIMAVVLCVTLLPISVKANQVPESITITREDLDQAIADYSDEKGYGVNAEKGIEYYKVTGEYKAGNGFFALYEATEYILGDDITLDGEAIVFADFSTREILSASLNLNNHKLNYINISSTEGLGHLAAVNVYSRELIIKGNGEIVCNSNTINAVDNLGRLIINGGTYNGDITTYDLKRNPDAEERLGMIPETFINSGTFKGELYLGVHTVINGGTFDNNILTYNLTEVNSGQFNRNYNNFGDTIINDGTFNKKVVSLNGNMTINDGSFYGHNKFSELDDLDVKIIINGGKFIYDGDPDNATIDIENITVIINDAYVENKSYAPSDDYFPTAIYVIKSDDEISDSSFIVNGGTFKGGDYDYAVQVIDYDSIEINGGSFCGYLGALTIEAENYPNISLSGGKFTTYGPENEDMEGAISLVLPSDYYSENPSDEFFDFMLAEGYQFKPKAEVRNMGLIWRNTYFLTGTQKDMEVIPESKVVSDQDNDSLLTEVSAIVDQIKKGEIPEGVSAELAEAIVAALADGKDIDVEMTVTAVNPEDIKDETKAIAGLVTNTENIAGYYDIKVAVSIDGEVKGFITKFADDVLISLPEPEGLPPLAAGYERVFSLIRIHDGVATKLPAELKDGVINSYSDSYSIYALVYEDVKTAPDYDNTEVTPQTGDKGAILWISLASAFAAAGAVTFVYKKNKVEE